MKSTPLFADVVDPDGTSPGFERWWKAYPNPPGKGRKRKKMKAYGCWKRFRLEGATDKMIALLERYKRWDNWTKEGGQYVPMPTSWLNAKPWNDPDPLAEQEAMAAHAKRLVAERMQAARNPVAKQIATKFQDFEDKSLSDWSKLSGAAKKVIWDEYLASLPNDFSRRVAKEISVRRWWSQQEEREG